MSLPEPPVDVRLVLFDDSEVPVDTVYVGKDEEGIHLWQIVTGPPLEQVKTVKIEKLPPQTGVAMGDGYTGTTD